MSEATAARQPMRTSLPAHPVELSSSSPKEVTPPHANTTHAQEPVNNDHAIHMPHSASQTSTFDLGMSTRNQVASLRQLILTTRPSVKREKILCKQQETFLDGVMDELESMLESVVDDDDYMSRKHGILELFVKIKTSRGTLKELREKSNHFEDDLSNHEYTLEKLEGEIYKDMDTEPGNAPQPCSPHPYATPEHGTVSEMESHTAPTRARDELYSRMSDARILLDRLCAFDYELREDLDERDLLRAAGQVDVIPDVQFFEQAKAERMKLQQDLEEAQSDVYRLKLLCTQHGIEFQDVQLPRFFYNSTDVDDGPSTESSGSLTVAVNTQSNALGMISAFFSKQKQVARWLRDPPGPDQAAIEGETAGRNMWDESRHISRLDGDWVPVHTPRQQSRDRRPRLSESLGAGGASRLPEWTCGPPPGSKLIEALLLESTSELLGPTVRKRESHTSL